MNDLPANTAPTLYEPCKKESFQKLLVKKMNIYYVQNDMEF